MIEPDPIRVGHRFSPTATIAAASEGKGARLAGRGRRGFGIVLHAEAGGVA